MFFKPSILRNADRYRWGQVCHRQPELQSVSFVEKKNVIMVYRVLSPRDGIFAKGGGPTVHNVGRCDLVETAEHHPCHLCRQHLNDDKS